MGYGNSESKLHIYIILDVCVFFYQLNPCFFAGSVTSLPGNNDSDVLNVTDYIGLLDKSREAGKDFFFLRQHCHV